MSPPVIVVGAGPVGLSMVALLARLDVPCVLLEAGARLENRAGSRAICVQRDVIEILERIGCGRALAAAGVHVRRGRTYFGRRQIFRAEMPREPNAAFPAYVSYPQVELERLLLERIEAHPRVELRWSHRVERLEQDDAGVRVHARGPEGAVVLAGSHVVGCDGARSTVREVLGMRFDGYRHPESFLIADVRGPLPYASGERHFFFSPPFNPGRQVLLFPQPAGVWRIDWQVPARFGDPDAERASGRLAARVAQIAGHADCELVWLSAYRFQQRVAARFRVGRAFLAGDAAHLMAPFGARGMTSGIADAENLAWKLACVRAGHAGPELLDTYELERRAAAQHNVATVEASLRFMAPPTRRARLVRDAILHASRFSAAARRRVDAGKLYQPFRYAEGALAGHRGHPSIGALAEDARCELDGRAVRLRELLGASLFALYVPGEKDDAARFAARAAPLAARAPLEVHVANAGPLPAPIRALHDRRGDLAARFGPGLLVLRPDGHIAARHRGSAASSVDALATVVAQILYTTP